MLQVERKKTKKKRKRKRVKTAAGWPADSHTIKPQKSFDGSKLKVSSTAVQRAQSEHVVEAHCCFQTSVTFWFYSTISLILPLKTCYN